LSKELDLEVRWRDPLPEFGLFSEGQVRRVPRAFSPRMETGGKERFRGRRPGRAEACQASDIYFRIAIKVPLHNNSPKIYVNSWVPVKPNIYFLVSVSYFFLKKFRITRRLAKEKPMANKPGLVSLAATATLIKS